MERAVVLRKYLHQVRPREESYVNHVDRIQGLCENQSANTDGVADVNEKLLDMYMTGLLKY